MAVLILSALLVTGFAHDGAQAGVESKLLRAFYPRGSWRYRITVEVDTPEGTKTGSSVREVSIQLVPQLTPEMKPTTHLSGEAVVVDLGNRGVVFALLKGYKVGSDHAKFLPFYIFPFGGDPVSKEGLKYYSNLKAGSKEIDPEWYPIFVHFLNPKDPKSIQSLIEMDRCPNQIPASETLCVKKDHFEDAFGAGVKVKSVKIEMTDLPVTSYVGKYLPPYIQDEDFKSWFRKLPWEDTRRIGPYDFISKN
jgi:hypothetical protein